VIEVENTLQNKLSQHESDLLEMQSKLDEMRSELSATKREEKELRSKEVVIFCPFLFVSLNKIFFFSAPNYDPDSSTGTRSFKGLKSVGSGAVDVYKLTATISRTMRSVIFAHLAIDEQKLNYILAVSERYRDDLRQREEIIRNLRETGALHELEAEKWQKERETFEARIIGLEETLAIADAAHTQLEEQKQENLLLKETIDRMRFDMDELRSNAVGRGWG